MRPRMHTDGHGHGHGFSTFTARIIADLKECILEMLQEMGESLEGEHGG